ncbi:hypothetical protein FYK55_12100 [Roseiconus nitratireducens]|uniref:Uncharacterized protein n=1 Tax=Roseiconus nitratireducens TaxID=2605748 RepID=A0A5M6D9S5_9BACT|nr:hypothetical protein [Roseiconus nitratireducens]KAA5543032.1 hypothetical protein FYK55_12100 [Roseiconus nitratireducens]
MMFSQNWKMVAPLMLATACFLGGCSQSTDSTAEVSGSQTHADGDHEGHDDHAGHEDHAEHEAGGHPEHGPHGGDLIELGNEAYHGELVHGEDGVSIYLLDGAAKEAVTIPAESLSLSLKHDGQVQTFELAANSDAAAGGNAQFTSTEATLDEWLDAGAEGAITVEIEGKSYTGKLSHDHDHDEHGH